MSNTWLAGWLAVAMCPIPGISYHGRPAWPPCFPAAGWDLACKLLCKRNALNRGRLSAVEALRHPFLLFDI